MKVYVVIDKSWDTDGNLDVCLAGVYSSLDKIPDRFKTEYSHQSYDVTEMEVDKVEDW